MTALHFPTCQWTVSLALGVVSLYCSLFAIVVKTGLSDGSVNEKESD